MPSLHSFKHDSVSKPHSILHRAVSLSLHPGRMILFPFRKWYHHRYEGKYRYERAVFAFDLVLIGVVVALASVAITLFLFPRKQFEDNISFTATVAPREIVAGASSTLVIAYHNNTKETLRHTKLDLTFPDHFLLQSIRVNDKEVSEHNIDLDDVAVGAGGDIHVKGVMFGDVGGKQTFRSSMTFVHGTSLDITGTKRSDYTFSPAHSTLQLSLSLPDRVITNQLITGTITYKNTGTIDFPEISITPQWPNGFSLSSSTPHLDNGMFALPKIRAGASGQMTFAGFLGDVPDHVDFRFHPSFAFGNDRYTQETLTQSIPVMPAQIKLTETIDEKNLKPGTNATFTIHYKAVGTESLYNLELGIVSDSPFVPIDKQTVSSKNNPALKLVHPGDEGDVTLVIPVRSNVSQSALSKTHEIQIQTHVIAHYKIDSQAGSGDPAHSLVTTTQDLISNLTTPITFESFARYVTPSGDQIGRGPLPPRVGAKTSYWVFWHVDGTTNTIDHVAIEGILPNNVTYTGHETSSESNGVSFDPETRKIHWNVSSIPPTLDPASRVFSVAFEVEITPTSAQIGTTPTILKDVHLTGTDAFTGDFVSATGSSVTTKLAGDAMAGVKGIVRN